MSRVLCITGFLLLFSLSRNSFSDAGDPISIPSNPPKKYESFSLKYKGTDGVWFPLSMANAVLVDLDKCELRLRSFELQREKLVLLDTGLKIKDQQIEDLRLAVSLSKSIESDLKDALKASENSVKDAEMRARKAEENKNAWYRHPALWLVAGIALTAIVEVVIVKVIN